MKDRNGNKIDFNSVLAACVLNIGESLCNCVFVVSFRVYSGDGNQLKTSWENLGIASKLENAVILASSYVNYYRGTVFITSVELDKPVSF